jgi:hypothetical protein
MTVIYKASLVMSHVVSGSCLNPDVFFLPNTQ